MLTKRRRNDLMQLGCLTVAQAAEFATLSTDAIYSAMRRKELPFAKKGRRRLLPKVGLIEWLGMSIQE